MTKEPEELRSGSSDVREPVAKEPKTGEDFVSPSHPRTSQRRLIDLLGEVAEVHRKLSEFYGRLGKQAERPKAKLLLEFMQQHERSVQECIQEFEEESDNEALQAWFKYTPDIEPERWIGEVEFRPDMTDDEIAAIVARIDDMLMEAFDQLADRAVPERLRDAVEAFAQIEQRAKIRALRATEAE